MSWDINSEFSQQVGSLILHFVQNDITCSGIFLNKLRRPSNSIRERGDKDDTKKVEILLIWVSIVLSLFIYRRDNG